MEPSQIRAAIRQWLLTERMLGMDSVPIPASAMLGAVGATAARVPANPAGQTPASEASSASDASGAVREKAERLDALNHSQVVRCTKCSLSASRTQTVFGAGNPNARLVFVGEAPGFEEDRRGLPFVGKAGELLTKMIAAMGLSRDDVYICNVLKCRPPSNRDPLADEIIACSPYLMEQLAIIEPEVLIALGAPAAKTLLRTAESIGRLRGRFHDYWLSGAPGVGAGIPLMPTYHPAYLLRNPSDKRHAWSDLQQVMSRLGLPEPRRDAT